MNISPQSTPSEGKVTPAQVTKYFVVYLKFQEATHISSYTGAETQIPKVPYLAAPKYGTVSGNQERMNTL